MIRTKYVVVSFVVLAIICAGGAIYLLLHSSAGQPRADIDTTPDFVKAEYAYDVTPSSSVDHDAMRSALKEAIAEQGGVPLTSTEESEVPSDEADHAEGEATAPATSPTSTPESDADVPPVAPSTSVGSTTPPLFSVVVHDGVRSTSLIGTPGSNCWYGTCDVRLVTDLPYQPRGVSASGTISYQVDTFGLHEPPTNIFVFFKPMVAGSTTLQSIELTTTERARRRFAVPNTVGTYIMTITGVWQGKREASSVFEIEIK